MDGDFSTSVIEKVCEVFFQAIREYPDASIAEISDMANSLGLYNVTISTLLDNAAQAAGVPNTIPSLAQPGKKKKPRKAKLNLKGQGGRDMLDKQVLSYMKAMGEGYTFTTADIQGAMKVTRYSAKASLHRLAQLGHVVNNASMTKPQWEVAD